MRILKLTAEGEGGFDVDLHPYVTIIQGLDGSQRDRLLRALRAVPRGEDPGIGGLVEANGVLLDLTPETLALLELQTSVDVVVAAGDLPGAAGTEPEVAAPAVDVDAVRARAEEAAAAVAALDARLAEARDALDHAETARAAAAAAVEEARQRATVPEPVADEEVAGPWVDDDASDVDERAAAVAALEDARRRLADAEAERGRAEIELDEARAAREAASRACSYLAAELEEVGVGRDPAAADALEAARAELAALEAALAEEQTTSPAEDAPPEDAASFLAELPFADDTPETGADAPSFFAELPFAGDEDDAADAGTEPESQPGDTGDTGEPGPASEQVAALERRLDDLAASLFALEADPGPVASALADAHFAQQDSDLVPSDEALTIADELESLGRQLVAFVGRSDVDSELVAAARNRLEDARVALADAESSARLPDMDRADVQELEQAHAAVLAAQERADSRFGGSRAQKKLTEARETERAVLERMSLTTYAEYLMGASLLRVDPTAETGLEAARNELLAAEDAWMGLQHRVDEDLAHSALVDRRRELRERARQLLGRRVADDDLVDELRELRVPTGSTIEVATRLQSALAAAGMDLGGEPLALDELVELAELWLVEQEASLDRAAAIRRELSEVEAELDAARRGAQEREVPPVPAPAFDPEPDTDPAAERCRQQLREARAALAAAEARVAADEDAEARLVDARARLDEAAEAEAEAASRVHDIETALVALADEIAAAGAAAGEAEQRIAVLDEAAGAVAERLEDEPVAEDEPDVVELAEDRSEAVEPEATGDESTLVDALAEADMALANASAEVQALEAEQPVLADRAAAAALELDEATAAFEEPAPAPAAPRIDPDEIEWFLLARLAAQRSVSYAGSVPIVLDDTLADLGPGLTRRLLERLERMAAAVQVLYVSDDPEIGEWAASLGEERAAVAHAGVPAVAVAASVADAPS